MDVSNKQVNAQQQQSQFEVNLDELDRKVREYRTTQERNNILYFFIQDTRRNEFYKVQLENGNLNFSKENSQTWPLAINKLSALMDQIDERLEPYQATHTFFTKDVIIRAEQGELESLKSILTDFFNDELRREQFFKEVGIPHPEKRIWYQ